MKTPFEELDFQRTPMGELILQRRLIKALNDVDVYEVKLNGEYLMSSLFHAAEVALADQGLGALETVRPEAGPGDGPKTEPRTGPWDVVVGGLGLGYTAAAALRFPQVRRLIIVEALQPVIDWHVRGLTPNGKALTDDPRCSYRLADFFALARGPGFDADHAGHRFDAVLLDVDHTPAQPLSPAHSDFYTEQGLRRLTAFLKPGGVFGLWSDEAPDDGFLRLLARVFAHAEGHLITFDNPILDTTATNGIYLARHHA